MVHVGHNCDIGKHVVIAAQTGISGSVTIEDDCVIGGQVGFGDHIRVQSGAVIGSKPASCPARLCGRAFGGAFRFNRWMNTSDSTRIGRVPQLREEVKELKEKLAQLEELLQKRKQ
jgi:UDP-3-O-[3-hydroxymyristoyl] glucosamine N-acyltransferase